MTKHSCTGCTQSRGNEWKENFLLSTFLLSPSECSLETSETSFLRADFPLFQRRGNRGLLTYKAQCFGTSVILLSPCQSDGASLQQTTGQWGWTLRLFHPYELTRIGLKSSLEKKKKSLLQLALQTVGKHRWRGWQEKQLLLLGFLSVWILRRRTRNSITDWNAIYTFLKMWRCSLKYGLPCCGNLLVSGGGEGRPSSRPSSSGPDSSRPPVCHHRLKHKWLKGAISTQHDPAKTPDKWFTLLSHS